jgi:hypothetical protein
MVLALNSRLLADIGLARDGTPFTGVRTPRLRSPPRPTSSSTLMPPSPALTSSSSSGQTRQFSCSEAYREKGETRHVHSI